MGGSCEEASRTVDVSLEGFSVGQGSVNVTEGGGQVVRNVACGFDHSNSGRIRTE